MFRVIYGTSQFSVPGMRSEVFFAEARQRRVSTWSSSEMRGEERITLEHLMDECVVKTLEVLFAVSCISGERKPIFYFQ